MVDDLIYPVVIIPEAVVSGLKHKCFPNGKEGVKNQLLRYYPQYATRFTIVTDNIVSHYLHAPAAGQCQAGNNIDQRSFSCTVGAEQSEELTSMDFEIHASQSI